MKLGQGGGLCSRGRFSEQPWSQQTHQQCCCEPGMHHEVERLLGLEVGVASLELLPQLLRLFGIA